MEQRVQSQNCTFTYLGNSTPSGRIACRDLLSHRVCRHWMAMCTLGRLPSTATASAPSTHFHWVSSSCPPARRYQAVHFRVGRDLILSCCVSERKAPRDPASGDGRADRAWCLVLPTPSSCVCGDRFFGSSVHCINRVIQRKNKYSYNDVFLDNDIYVDEIASVGNYIAFAENRVLRQITKLEFRRFPKGQTVLKKQRKDESKKVLPCKV